MDREFTFIGKTDTRGVLRMSRKEEMDAFFRKWPNAKVVFNGRVLPGQPQREMIGFYNHSIVPVFSRVYRQHGVHITKQDLQEELKALCPVMIEEIFNDEGHEVKLRNLASCGVEELRLFFLHLEQIAAEVFDLKYEWSHYLK